jgi:hypothetical protein
MIQDSSSSCPNEIKIPILINFSNHPSCSWLDEQLEAASVYGEIRDIPFPDVELEGDEAYIESLCREYTEKIIQAAQSETVTVHVMGEMTLTYRLVKSLQAKGIPCLASTTRRIVTDVDAGSKNVQFAFTRFRAY